MYTKSTFVIMAVIIIFKDFRIRKVLLNLVVTNKPEFLSKFNFYFVIRMHIKFSYLLKLAIFFIPPSIRYKGLLHSLCEQ